MGQLAVVADVTLRTVTTGSVALDGLRSFRLRDADAMPRIAQGERLVWFTLLLSADEVASGRDLLGVWQERFRSTADLLAPYTYEFADGQSPPLFYGRAGRFTAVGVWARAPTAALKAEMESLFSELAASSGLRRYVQSETLEGPKAYREYFGEELYERFREMKERLDPQHLFNRDTVFPYVKLQ
jgi:hypothetical protein